MFLYIMKGGEREGGREGERERGGRHAPTHTTERTLEKQDKAAEDKTVGGIFSGAW